MLQAVEDSLLMLQAVEDSLLMLQEVEDSLLMLQAAEDSLLMLHMVEDSETGNGLRDQISQVQAYKLQTVKVKCLST